MFLCTAASKEKTYSLVCSGKVGKSKAGTSTHPRRRRFAAQHPAEQTYGFVVWSRDTSKAMDTEIKSVRDNRSREQREIHFYLLGFYFDKVSAAESKNLA